MDPGEIYRPWLAIHVVALFAQHMPAKVIADWSDRGLVEGAKEQKPGRGKSRRYSLANAVVLHAMYIATRHGLSSLSLAAKIGQACLIRLLKRNDPERAGKISLKDPEGDFVFSFRVTGIPPKEQVQGAFLSLQDLANHILKTGLPAPAPLSMVMDIDGLIERIWNQYHDLDEAFNDLALEGRLKPFPAQLLLKGLYNDECESSATPRRSDHPNARPARRRPGRPVH
jgi:hypothetical protein